MLGIIELALGVIEEGLKLVNTKASRSHITKVADLKIKVKEALEKPYDQQDDAEIVSLYKELEIYMEQAKSIIQLKES